jgi:hypothetical protein
MRLKALQLTVLVIFFYHILYKHYVIFYFKLTSLADSVRLGWWLLILLRWKLDETIVDSPLITALQSRRTVHQVRYPVVAAIRTGSIRKALSIKATLPGKTTTF